MTKNRIREYRSKLGFSQRRLGVECGIYPGLICGYENGQRPNQPNAERIAKALKCDVRVLFPEYETFRRY